MRPALLACGIVVALCPPAFCQDDGGALPPEIDRAMWCGAAFGVVAETAAAEGDEERAEDYRAKAGSAFTVAAAALLADGLETDAFVTMAEDYARAVMAPFREMSLTESECDAVIEGNPGR